MRTILVISALAIGMSASAGAQMHGSHDAAPAKDATAKAAPAREVETKCPVTGRKVADITKAPKSVYQGTNYSFCTPGCKTKFDKQPTKYVKAAPAQAAEVKCPVMGGTVADIKTAPKSTYKGETYYFCCPGCKPQFDKDPAKYAKVTAKPDKKAPKARKPMPKIIDPMPNPMEPMPGHNH